MYYVVELWDGVLSVQFADGEPYGIILAGPFETYGEAHAEYVAFLEKDAAESPVIGH